MKRVLFSVFLGLALFAIYSSWETARRETGQKTDRKSVISPLSESFGINTLGVTDKKSDDYSIYGYLPYWTIDQTDNFDLTALTDVAYFGLYINADGTFLKTQTTEEGEISNPGYSNWRNNKQLASFIRRAKISGVDVALTIISHRDNVSTEFLNCRECWNTFYEALQEELAVHDIKDVNLNFEYYNLVEEETALKYTEFTKFVKKKLAQEHPERKVVVTAFADSLINNRVSHIPSLAKEADKIFIMAYDFHVSQADKAAPVSPLGGAGLHAGYDIRTMIKDYLAYAPPQKLILGVPYYGFNWGRGEEIAVEHTNEKPDEKEENSDEDKDVDAKDDDENDGGKNANENEVEIIRDSVTQTYADIMKNIEEKSAEVQWDEVGQVPFYEYVDEDSEKPRKVYFENEKSLRVKYQLAKEFDLAGVGIWALGYDADRPELWELLKTEFILRN